MKKFILPLALIVSSFLGGAVAQTIGGAAVQTVLASSFFNGVLAYSGGQSAANSAFWSQVTSLTGSGNDAYSNPANAMFVTGDTATATTGSFDGLYLQHDFGGAAAGGRTGLNIRLRQTAATTEAAAAWVGLAIQAWGQATDGGTTGAGNGRGKVFAMNPQCILNGNATFFARCTGGEVNTTVATGANVEQKLGWSVIQANADQVQGSLFDGGYVLANQVSAVGWQCGWCTGNNDGNWPITSTGTIIGTWTHSQTAPGTSSVGTALYGIDFTQVTFAAGGAPILMPLITPASSGTTCKQGAIEWDANFVYICTSTNTWKRAALSTF
jgi:hypothetical protein